MRQNTRIGLLAGLMAIVVVVIIGMNFFQIQKLSSDEEFGDQVRAYLLDNPKVLREVIAKLSIVESREKEDQEQQALSMFETELENDGFSHVAGNPNGDVTIVEFFDYRCGYCKKSFPELLKAVETDGNVRLVLKEFPILGPDSVLASQAAIASQAQGKYMPFHKALMESRGSLTKTKIIELARATGIDVDRMLSDMSSEDISEKIARTYSLATQLKINGTPAFVIGGKLAAGAIPAEQMLAMVEKARENNTKNAAN